MRQLIGEAQIAIASASGRGLLDRTKSALSIVPQARTLIAILDWAEKVFALVENETKENKVKNMKSRIEATNKTIEFFKEQIKFWEEKKEIEKIRAEKAGCEKVD